MYITGDLDRSTLKDDTCGMTTFPRETQNGKMSTFQIHFFLMSSKKKKPTIQILYSSECKYSRVEVCAPYQLTAVVITSVFCTLSRYFVQNMKSTI